MVVVVETGGGGAPAVVVVDAGPNEFGDVVVVADDGAEVELVPFVDVDPELGDPDPRLPEPDEPLPDEPLPDEPFKEVPTAPPFPLLPVDAVVCSLAAGLSDVWAYAVPLTPETVESWPVLAVLAG